MNVEPLPYCGALKHGRVDLSCTLTEGHAGRHEADYHVEDAQTVRYHAALHTITTTTHEHVEWEATDPLAQLARTLKARAVREEPTP